LVIYNKFIIDDQNFSKFVLFFSLIFETSSDCAQSLDLCIAL